MNLLKKSLLVLTVTLAVSALSTASEAYRCAWRNGHRVCWHEGTTNYRVYKTTTVASCYNTRGFWRGGVWHAGSRVCR